MQCFYKASRLFIWGRLRFKFARCSLHGFWHIF